MTPADTASASTDRVLIVEDDAAQRLGLQQLIRSWGFAVDVASDGRDALEKITADRPTIVLERSRHAEHRRAWTCSRRSSRTTPDITVVLLTGARHGGNGGRGHQARRLRLPAEAHRPAAAEDPPRRRSSSATTRCARCRRCGANCATTAAFGRMIGAQPGHARDLPDGRAGRADERVGARHRRVGHGQGTGGADGPPAEPARLAAVRADQLRRHPGHPARVGAVRPREGRLHRRHRAAAGLRSSWPTAARSSSTKSPR